MGPLYFPVPAGTPVAECRGCSARIYWITTAKGRHMPVACDVDDQSHEPSGAEEGVGISHFVDCPQANHFRKARKP